MVAVFVETLETLEHWPKLSGRISLSESAQTSPRKPDSRPSSAPASQCCTLQASYSERDYHKEWVEMTRTKFSDLRNELLAKPSVIQRLAASRQETEEELRQHALHQEESADSPIDLKDDFAE
jgi:hypothetical protein